MTAPYIFSFLSMYIIFHSMLLLQSQCRPALCLDRLRATHAYIRVVQLMCALHSYYIRPVRCIRILNIKCNNIPHLPCEVVKIIRLYLFNGVQRFTTL